jgi:cell division protease FtsH
MNNKKITFNIWYIFLVMWGILLLQTWWIREQTPVERIPYSQFQTYLADGRIEEVRIASNYIEGTLKDPPEGRPKKFMTVQVAPELAEELAAHQVRFSGEIESTFLRDMLSWVVHAGNATLIPASLLSLFIQVQTVVVSAA